MKKSIEILSNLEDQCKKELSSVCDHIKDCYTNLKDLPEGKNKHIVIPNFILCVNFISQNSRGYGDKHGGCCSNIGKRNKTIEQQVKIWSVGHLILT